MRIGIISLGGKSSKALAEACKEFFDSVDELDLKQFKVHLTDDGIGINYNGKDFDEYDCLYIRGSYKYALLQRAIAKALFKKVYMPIEPKSFSLAHDKFLTLLELQHAGVAIPKTYYASNTDLAKKILEEVNYPIIMKVQEGTHGKGVMIADSLKSARTILDILEEFKKPYLIQEFVKTKETSDIRAIVAGNKVIAAYKRVAKEGEIRTNIHSGGKRKPYQLNKSEEKLAVKSAKAIGAELCGIDIFHSDRPSVIEVNLSPSVYRIGNVAKTNVLREIAKYLYLSTVKFKEKKQEKIKKKISKIKKSEEESKLNAHESYKENEGKIEKKKSNKKISKSKSVQKKASSLQQYLD